MFGWFEIRSSVTPKQRAWIDDRFSWLRQEFGESILSRPPVTPTKEFFPERYRCNHDSAIAVQHRLCELMGVDSRRFKLCFFAGRGNNPYAVRVSNQVDTLGLFQQSGEQIQIWLEQDQILDQEALIATLAHELGHVHLLADGRIDRDQDDHEPLTDLLCVYFGFGIFLANQSIREKTSRNGHVSWWTVGKAGYLSLAELSYALAVASYSRGEIKPAWSKHLRRDSQALLKLELKHLQAGTVPPLEKVVVQNDADTSDIEEELGSSGDSANIEPESTESQSVVDVQMESNSSDTDDSDGSPRLGADEYFTRGMANYSARDWQQGVENFRMAVRLAPRDAEAWRCLGQSYSKLGNHRAAVENCSRAIQLDAEDIAAYHCRGFAYLWLRQYPEALADADGGLRIADCDPTSRYIRGLALFGKGDPGKALADLRRVTYLAPTFVENYLVRSCIFAAIGRTKEAEASRAEAIRRDPSLRDPEELRSMLREIPVVTTDPLH